MKNELRDEQIKAIADVLYNEMDDRPRMFPREWTLDVAERMFDAAIAVLNPDNELKEAQVAALAKKLVDMKMVRPAAARGAARVLHHAMTSATADSEQLSFVNEPVSLSAKRAEKSDLARDWTPRDALNHALAECDDWQFAVVCFGKVDSVGGTDVVTIVSAPNAFVSQGILNEAIATFHE